MGKKQLTRGGKNSFDFPPTSGKNLIYDVYAGTTSQARKRGFTVTPSGNYLTFDGWAILKGHHHHAEQNQATYVGLVNKRDSNDRLIFKTAMRANTSANKGVHDEQLPKCPSNAFNRPVVLGQSGACNMDYNYTQFRAYIDLRDIFSEENEGKEWLLYIIKRVEDQIVYDRLILPFDTEAFDWRDGRVTMRSGEDAKTLSMVGADVIKRTGISGSGPSGNQRYFAPSFKYKTNGVDDAPSSNVSVWYRVYDNVTVTTGGRSYVATNSNRWASSTFWDFGGSIATLKYEKTKKTCPDGTKVDKNENCTVHVTIHHTDASTGENLRTDNKKAIVTKPYSFSAEKKGVFKDSEGRPYVPVPASQVESGTTPSHNLTFNFLYKAVIDDPTEPIEIPNPEGKADGLGSAPILFMLLFSYPVVYLSIAQVIH